MENAYLFVPVVISLIVSLFAWRAVFLRAMKVYALALGLVVVMSLGLYIAAVTANGWDGITYAIILVLGSLPAVGAMFLGGLVGLLTRRALPLPS
ncbi:hypothetical protein [Tateyamaria sp. SN6-1]|uniref:hypothetical protein n=1 Tax=Tateyamaria sp. SN6-1 TaxID=3092148 RepID=UPI0039F62AA6